MIKAITHVGSYEYATQEDRSAPRVRMTVPGYIRAIGGKRLVTTTRDISLTGFAAVAIQRFNVGTRCWLTLAGMPSREATVVWWEGGIVGCAFEQMLPGAELEYLVDRWR
jgi:hypothetical protein